MKALPVKIELYRPFSLLIFRREDRNEKNQFCGIICCTLDYADGLRSVTNTRGLQQHSTLQQPTATPGTDTRSIRFTRSRRRMRPARKSRSRRLRRKSYRLPLRRRKFCSRLAWLTASWACRITIIIPKEVEGKTKVGGVVEPNTEAILAAQADLVVRGFRLSKRRSTICVRSA